MAAGVRRSQVDGVALPSLDALLARLVETNRAAEELARWVLPAVRGVLERYVRHVLPREMSAVRSKAATRSLRASGGAGADAKGRGAGPPPESSSESRAQRQQGLAIATAARVAFGNDPASEEGGRGAPRGGDGWTDPGGPGGPPGLGGPPPPPAMAWGGLGETADLERELVRLTDCISERPAQPLRPPEHSVSIPCSQSSTPPQAHTCGGQSLSFRHPRLPCVAPPWVRSG